jgi:ankyrin repeat protein
LKDYIQTNLEYDPLKDIDEDGNNPLHLTAKYGIYEFFDVLCNHK